MIDVINNSYNQKKKKKTGDNEQKQFNCILENRKYMKMIEMCVWQIMVENNKWN